MSLRTIFISHESTDQGVAEALEQLFRRAFAEAHPVTVRRSTSANPEVGPRAGEQWRTWIEDAANADECVFILRRRPSDWLLWEMGAVAAYSVSARRASRGIPILVGLLPTDLPPQIDQNQAVDGTTREGMQRLLKTWNGRHELFQKKFRDEYVEALFEGHIDTYLATLASSGVLRDEHIDIGRKLDQTRDALLTAARTPNSMFRRVVGLFASSIATIGRDALESSLLFIPAVRYPQYLLELQGNQQRRVNAIAVVDDVEHFWRDRVGVRIANQAHPDSRRVFVFKSIDRFKNYWDILSRHATKYKVRAISHEALVRLSPGYDKDFSIIDDADGGAGHVVAYYAERNADNGQPLEIAFDGRPDTLLERQGVFNDIWNRSREVDPAADLNALAEEVFGPGRPRLRPLGKRTTEMSEYIDIDDYDRHEEEHAYYREMMQQMGQLLEAEAARANLTAARVLEVGAGTGIFTCRLLEMPSVGEIHAIELDWECNRRLHRKFRRVPRERLTIHCEDSRTYNPEGSFDFVVSSFADHHIGLEDKVEYLLNVRNNLRRDGLFIVGDEFLREPVLADPEAERREALHSYHQHIIDIARRAGHLELAGLEESALRSGLEGRGDFKIPRSRYRAAVEAARFVIVDEMAIGPDTGQEQIGGVFVFVMRHAGLAR